MHKILSSLHIFVTCLCFVSSYCIITKPKRCYICNGKHYKGPYFNLNRFSKHSNRDRSELIIGGDLEDPPPIVREIQTEESKRFVDDCLKKELSINEAINYLNDFSDKDDYLILDNLLNENKDTQSNRKTEITNDDKNNLNFKDVESPPVGTVELDPIYENEWLDDDDDEGEEDEENIPEVDIGLLSNSEMSIIYEIMKERVKKQGSDCKSAVLKIVENDPVKYNKEEIMKQFDQLDEFAQLFLKLNNTVNRNPLDLQWVTKVETKLYRFLKQKNYTLSTCTWTVDSLNITLKEQVK
ncbi:hypothetical protein MACK_003451 [Theileria orientalis]|uniref:Plasmodium RESA N-terminal domain-containing protein n=1 Tax=Theileria orientalis TaxID=68886 RepID=A0A976SJ45_THEOR|nr:hypothetical protein MACK_003451 [Theileria orientalis]